MSQGIMHGDLVCKLNEELLRVRGENARLHGELEEKQAALRRCKCIYCGLEVPFEEQDKLVNHITSCEKSPLVQMVKDMESRVIDYMDIMNDEFVRISTLTKDPEIVGICQRASLVITQKEPVIKQRDDALANLQRHKSALENAMEALVDAQNALRSSDDNEQMACIASLEVHLAAIDEVLK